MTSDPKPPRWARPALGLVTLVVSLGIAEFVMRRLEKPAAPNIIFQTFEQNMHNVHLDDFASFTTIDPDLYWVLNPNHRLPDDARHIRGLVANAAGLREDHEIPTNKPAGEYRVLFLGDSCTFGFNVLHNETFVEKVEQILKQRLPGTPVECVNCGVPGYSSYQGLEWLKRYGVQYQPDAVVATFGWNDSRKWDVYTDVEHHERNVRSTPPGPLSMSAICRRVWQLRGALPPRAEKCFRVPPDQYEVVMNQIAELARECGAQPVLVDWAFNKNVEQGVVTNVNPYQTIVRNLGDRAVIVDLLPVIRRAVKEHNAGALFMDYGHTTPLANDYIADAIAASLMSNYEATVRQSGVTGKKTAHRERHG